MTLPTHGQYFTVISGKPENIDFHMDIFRCVVDPALPLGKVCGTVVAAKYKTKGKFGLKGATYSFTPNEWIFLIYPDELIKELAKLGKEEEERVKPKFNFEEEWFKMNMGGGPHTRTRNPRDSDPYANSSGSRSYGAGPTTTPKPQETIEGAMLKILIMLCHPDKHNNSPASSKAFQYLIKLRD